MSPNIDVTDSHLPPIEWAQLLIQAVQELSAAGALSQVIELATRAARRGSGADGVSFVLRDGDECFYVNEDAIGPLWKGQRFPMSACVSGWCMTHRVAAVIPNIALDDRVPQEAYLPTFVRSLVMVPIRRIDPIGAIGAYWANSRIPPKEIVDWLQALADSASAGISAIRAKTAATFPAPRSAANEPSSPELVRICPWTKRIFFNGDWIEFEAYLQECHGLSVTHGICPEAQKRFLGEVP